MIRGEPMDHHSDMSCDLGETSTTGDGMTGKVGTALYVAPELAKGTTRLKYSHKVDLYSLGIIFFEMCYRALPTGMERVKAIGNIRTVCQQKKWSHKCKLAASMFLGIPITKKSTNQTSKCIPLQYCTSCISAVGYILINI